MEELVVEARREEKVDAKTYLNQIRVLDVHINNKLEELARMKALSTKVTTYLKPVPASGGGGGQDKLGDVVSKIIDLESEINEAIDRFVDKKREVSGLVERITDPDELKVIYKRYFQNETLEQVACEMNYTYRNVCYIHGRALSSVETLLKSEKEG